MDSSSPEPRPVQCPLEDIAPRGQRFGCQRVGRGSSVADVGTEIPRASDPTVVVTQATPLVPVWWPDGAVDLTLPAPRQQSVREGIPPIPSRRTASPLLPRINHSGNDVSPFGVSSTPLSTISDQNMWGIGWGPCIIPAIGLRRMSVLTIAGCPPARTSRLAEATAPLRKAVPVGAAPVGSSSWTTTCSAP